jgi:putative ABC transport system permease protein
MSVAHAPTGHKRAIGRQIQLPNRKAFEIAWKSIKIRFWRSMITAAGIFLGIAFYSSVRMSATFSDIQAGIVQEKREAMLRGEKLSSDDIQLINSAMDNPKEKEAAKTRLTWLSIMALIVCTVGIANAMLMSVTERYKEIGTMKCLGALDLLIVKLFFIESGLLGLFASIMGCILGWLVISFFHLISDGLPAFGMVFWRASLNLFWMSAVIGTVLTLLATIFPAIRAAKMPPVAALRVEI